MDQNRCKRCGKTMARRKDHPCYFHKKFDYKYLRQHPVEWDKKHDEEKENSTENPNDNSQHLSQSFRPNESEKCEALNLSLFQNNQNVNSLPSEGNMRTIFAESCNNAQVCNPCKISDINPISNIQITEVQSKENASFIGTSENFAFVHRPDNIRREDYEERTLAAGSSGVEIQKQKASGVSDLLRATSDEECEISLENSKWQSLNTGKSIFVDSLEHVTKNIVSDNNNIYENANLISNPDLQLRSNEPKTGKSQVSECVNVVSISSELLSQRCNKNEIIALNLKKPISVTEGDNAVAGPSGICTGKKKFPKICRGEDNVKTKYRTHTREKRFVCDICKKKFSHKKTLLSHCRMHTGKTPYVCDKCGKKCSQKSNLDTHYRTHTGERPFVCDFCNEDFAQKFHLKIHLMRHTGENAYKCTACEKSFSNRYAYNKHRRETH